MEIKETVSGCFFLNTVSARVDVDRRGWNVTGKSRMLPGYSYLYRAMPCLVRTWCLSVWWSDIRRYCVQMAEDIVEIFCCQPDCCISQTESRNE